MPGVGADVVVVEALGEEHRLRAEALALVEAEGVAPERRGRLDVGGLEVDVADVAARRQPVVDGLGQERGQVQAAG